MTTNDEVWVPDACSPGGGAVRLDVEVPAAHVDVLDALAERAAAGAGA